MHSNYRQKGWHRKHNKYKLFWQSSSAKGDRKSQIIWALKGLLCICRHKQQTIKTELLNISQLANSQKTWNSIFKYIFFFKRKTSILRLNSEIIFLTLIISVVHIKHPEDWSLSITFGAVHWRFLFLGLNTFTNSYERCKLVSKYLWAVKEHIKV